MIGVFLLLVIGNFLTQKIFQSSDGFGGISASQLIRLIGKFYIQIIEIYICGERPLSYLC